jgi:hypothetical protein
MVAVELLNEVITLAEAADVAEQLGHPLDRAHLTRYAQASRLPARTSKGTWLTTRGAGRDLIVSLEAEARGRPRVVEIEQLKVKYNRTPELAATLKQIHAMRAKLRARRLSPEREAKLWDELTTLAIYHTNHLEGNPLTFEEARAVIEAHRRDTSQAR